MTTTKIRKYVDGVAVVTDFDRDKLVRFVSQLNFGLDITIANLEEIVETISQGLPDITNKEDLLHQTSETLATRVIYHPDYSLLAGRVEAAILHSNNDILFSDNVVRVYNLVNTRSGKRYGLISDEFYQLVMANKKAFNKMINKNRDFDLTYFGMKTLMNSYLLSVNNQILETPQFMFLRVAIVIHGSKLSDVFETYELMSKKYFIHASPTLCNAGSIDNYLSSCYLVAMEDDSIDGIYKTLHSTALISKAGGGIGLHVHNVRGNGAHISGTNGTSDGLIPMLRVFNNTARHVDQGGNKRPGAFAIYLEPWHSDIFDILDLRKNHGNEEMRTRDLFYGLWIPDLFMNRVKDNEIWSLFSPDEAPGLADCYGNEFEALYKRYESEGRFTKQVPAQKLWHAILQAQTETGTPYMLYKDSCNNKSNQKNLGTIKSSNLCCEIVEYSSPEESAVCNLGSLALPTYVVSSESDDEVHVRFDFEKLHFVTKVLTRNLNKVIDVTKYPVRSSKVSNKSHRPIAIGVQGFADLLLELRLPFESPEAKALNTQIFETIYHAAIESSIELAIEEGQYSSFKTSPASKGLLQFDLWEHKPSDLYDDWDYLKERVKKHGLRNSLLVAPMPTASTSQILGFSECFEPYTSNIYTRRVLSGEFQVVNKYLLKDLIDLGLWNLAMKNRLLLEKGSIQNISCIPDDLKKLYKTVWEISQKVVIELAADRGKFVDQLQSMNIYMQNPTFAKLTSCHFYGWKKGLKTGMYYLRTQAATLAIQFTVNTEEAGKLDKKIVTEPLKRKKYDEVKRVSVSEDFVERKKLCLEGFKSPDSKSPSSSQQQSPETATTPAEDYDIYDSTPVACTINSKDLTDCRACSG